MPEMVEPPWNVAHPLELWTLAFHQRAPTTTVAATARKSAVMATGLHTGCCFGFVSVAHRVQTTIGMVIANTTAAT
jgi:hypothetical protein